MPRAPTITVGTVELPGDVQTLDGFRAWVATLGECGPLVSFCDGEVHVEVSPQDHRTHGPVAVEVVLVLGQLAREAQLGRVFVPPSWFTHEPARVSSEPDFFLVRYSSIETGRVRINPERASELLGPPDMVLEIVSASSVRKDLVTLAQGYARAGIPEYWVIDARGEALDLRLLVLGPDGAYSPQRADADGFVPSPLFVRSFRLRRIVDRVGWPEFRLDVRHEGE